MPYGLCNVPVDSHCVMNQVLQGINFTLVYVDILTHFTNFDERLVHLQT